VDTTLDAPPPLVRRAVPPLATIALSAAWAALASASPTRTYHVAPLLAVLAWPLLERIRNGGRSTRSALGPVLGGLAVTGATATALALSGSLDGPALVGGSGFGEAVILIAAGSMWGLRILTRPRPGLLVTLLGDDRTDERKS
jgi:hypothetical protein